jgi:N-acetylmuramoyl-L-alanine amidase
VLSAAVPTVVVVNDDPETLGTTDGILPGRPVPNGTYHWFFPNGTTASVSGRTNDQIRLQLSQTAVAWVDAVGVEGLSRGTPPPRGRVLSLRLTPGDSSVVLRIPLPARIPFRIEEGNRELSVRLYGVAADADWIQYGNTDPRVRLVAFSQVTEDETLVTISLGHEAWGYRTKWLGNDLLVELRWPPIIDPRRPLAGRCIALDAGHPPGGATGPTGLREPDIVLAVARKAARLLARYGARVVLTRESNEPIGVYERTRVAEQSGAELLVSVHANALPDGVNPFTNNGTSVYYYHPRSADFARELDRALVRQFGFRDLGVGMGDLALARPTWMPAALVEGLFMMIPEQEAVLASEEGQWRYARGIVEGIAAFLRSRALRDR